MFSEKFGWTADGAFQPSRRRFVQGLAAGGAALGLGLWPKNSWALKGPGNANVLAGTDFDLTIGETPMDFTGRVRPAITVNGSLPAPILRWREGTTVNLRVANALPTGSIHGNETSIHWHGIILPANMDGVPGLSFNGIARGEAYQYRFTVNQGGTYWYHSHSAFQEQAGLYGPLIIDPIAPEPFAYDRDYVVMLSDWTDMDPTRLFARLKKMSMYDNYYMRTVGDFFNDAKRDGVAATVEDRKMWGQMRMSPTDLSDVNANTYTYLMNGTTALGNWTGLFRSGEKVRLRFINGSAMTYFDVRIPGLKMTVVAADGQYVHPVTVDEFRIAVAETFDVIVEPSGQDAFTIFAQDMGRTGYVSGTLAVREGLRAPVPAIDPRPLLTMQDMGMDHGSMGGMDMSGGKGMEMSCGANMGMAGMDHGAMTQESKPANADPDAGHDMAGMKGGAMADMDPGSMVTHPASETRNPLLDNQAMTVSSRLDDPGNGLRDNGRTVLSYSMLKSTFEDPDGRDPGREIQLHLTGHMEKFAWGFNGQKFSEVTPLRLNYGERVRIVLVNDTMMTHPIHLHGMWSDVEDAAGNFMVRKHTVDMPPGSKRSYRVRADALGLWAYHCHLLYHMEAGMMRAVQVGEGVA
ncbi:MULTISPECIES: copper resistance system multicopper oxidase [Pseudoxanthomonas]|jgi:CopA family copper-resistance protein|uniref:Copper resistance system multicopper oxidase n=1 Tax=Pseudoxanthomonas winnipegensis TaxID=2480810 RepID=A0A4Q8LYG7_9GAMM|nr:MULTISPECIES: copper resistance system multicopper oxidase [Pseudoxanthomonas]MBW8851244.1 copper resistance system multicopper oxidase [Xanthomonadales bacterium]KAF1709850.1 copper oxidase [Pseudoxanthomonas kalamensis DSM 18571]KAF1711656.1 copper oxidase [Pseudoxanthomonas sacheonensis]RZZ87149.1 copper resistance system multicopper oxidase [Pseudoxanthomonas winnipegensis]TAA37643.1 copper resistance system multicopper oxidase [Pseudoxanthomonas winnipegensis]